MSIAADAEVVSFDEIDSDDDLLNLLRVYCGEEGQGVLGHGLKGCSGVAELSVRLDS